MTNDISPNDITALFDRYEEIGQNPSQWNSNAQILMRAARVVYCQFEDSFSDKNKDPWVLIDHELFRVYYLLAGLALELYFKALIVQKNPSIIMKENKLEWGCHGHDLIELSKKADLDFSSERELLEHLKHTIVWKGRYPIDKNENTIFSKMTMYDVSGTHVREIREQVEIIYETARKAYFKRQKSDI